MKKSSLCVLFVLALVQDSAPADLTFCLPDEPDGRLDNNTVSIVPNDQSADQRGFCIPTDVAILRKVNNTDRNTYDLRPRKTFYTDISDVYKDGAAVTLETLDGTLDVGVLNNSCVFQAKGKTFVKFFMDEGSVMALEEDLFYLVVETSVETTRRRFQLYPTGLNLAGRRPVPTDYTTEQLPIRYISVFVLDDKNTTRSIKSASNSICKVNGDQFTKVTLGTLFFERATVEDICSTFHYTDQTLIVEGNLTLTDNDEKVNEDFGGRGTIEVVAVPGDCNNTELLASATRITISRPVLTTSTMVPPMPSPGPTNRTNSGGGGLNRGEIAGVIISSLIGVVGIVVAVALAVKRLEWLKKPPPAPEANELSALPDPEIVVEQKLEDTDTKRPYVFNLWPDGDELEELLPDGTPGTIPESAKNDADQLTALIMKDSCKLFYLIHHVSREELHKTNTAAWELLRDFNNRPFPPEILQKFIDVRVFDEDEGEGILELVPGPILTINVSLKKWRGKMKECAEWIRSKARVNCDTPDGQFVSSQTPSATESPPRFNVLPELTGSEPIESTFDSPLPAVQTVKTPGLQTHQPQLIDNQNRPPQPFSPSSKQQVPRPSHEQPPPPYSNPNPNVFVDIYRELKKMNEKGDKLVAASERTANNTGVMREAQEDTLALTEEVHETVTAPREDAQEGT